MLEFRITTPAEFTILLKQSIKMYAEDLLRVKEFPDFKAARNGAKTEVYSYIKNETNKENDRVYYLFNENNINVGYIWFKIEPQYNISVLLYIFIFPKFRRYGYAKQAMHLFEKESRQAGMAQTHLVVFLDNDKALPMYQKLGYVGIDEFSLYGAKVNTRRRMMKVL